MQVRVSDPTGTNTSGVWASPLRDIAHCLPYLILRTFNIVERKFIDTAPEEDKQRRMTMFVTFKDTVLQYIYNCSNPEIKNVDTAYTKAKLNEQPDEIVNIFNNWFTKVVLSFYFNGLREALHPGEKPIMPAGFLTFKTATDSTDKDAPDNV